MLVVAAVITARSSTFVMELVVIASTSARLYLQSLVVSFRVMEQRLPWRLLVPYQGYSQPLVLTEKKYKHCSLRFHFNMQQIDIDIY